MYAKSGFGYFRLGPTPTPTSTPNQVYAKNGFGYFRGEPINFEPKSGEGPPAWLLKEGAFNMQVRVRVRARVRLGFGFGLG